MTLERNKKNNLIYKNNSAVFDLKHPSIAEAKKYWKKHKIRINPKWHAFCASLNNIHSSKYISEDIFYNYIMPSLNNFALAWAYRDKNMFDIFMKEIKMPTTVLRCMHGNIHDSGYKLLNIENYQDALPNEETDYFIKPTLESGSGSNIKKCKIRNGNIYIDETLRDINELIYAYKGEFIIQAGISQSAILSDIYPYSVNTIRSMSLRYKDQIIILSNLLRLGNNQNYVSNTVTGGVVCGVDGNGNVTEFSYNSTFKKIFEHPFTREPFKNIALPNFSELGKIIIECHKRLPHFDLVAWDFGLDNLNQYVLIEYNLLYVALNEHQVIDGPIFEKYLDGILDTTQS